MPDLGQNERRGPRFLWWGWKNCWKRPVWFSRGIMGAPFVRELGVGPISYVWVNERQAREQDEWKRKQEATMEDRLRHAPDFDPGD